MKSTIWYTFLMIDIKILSEKDLPEVMQLCAKIFTPVLKGIDKNEKKSIWWDTYEQNGLLIGAYHEKDLVGFIFFYEKDPKTKNIHCWMDGVDEQFRNQGIFTTLIETGLRELKKRGYEYMTINTFPEKFPVMFSFLQKHDFVEYKEEQKEWHGEITKKVFFRKKL
jgi:ribosomal protein S18 acetylase RimI-like enzyme